ncbi:hypothetical protein JXL19_08360 [bacterium]|nr:hypothetical protein [bacterium]
MPLHWTYADIEEDTLFQGDIVEPTDEILSALRGIQPSFLASKYNAYILITQSCDLVPYGGKYGTEYLNIAAVCPLQIVLNALLSRICDPIIVGAYFKDSKGKADSLLKRVFNQNEQAFGLFYLYHDDTAGINEHSVALLREVLTLPINHYDLFKRARRGRLSPEFRSKLCWLVGNLYSRVGTQDWYKSKEREKELEKLVDKFLDINNNPYAPIWIPNSLINTAKEEGVDPGQFPKDQIYSKMESYKPPSVKEQAVQVASDILKKIMSSPDENFQKLFCHRLRNDPLFAKALQQAKYE